MTSRHTPRTGEDGRRRRLWGPGHRAGAAWLLLSAASLAPPSASAATSPGAVETDVKPKRAVVRVDGEIVGQARDYNDPWNLLWLESGEHILEFGKEGYRTLRRRIDVRPAMQVRIVERLQKGEGLDPRSSPDTTIDAAGDERGAASPIDPPAARSLPVGYLRLAVEPGDAAVYLDGEFLARGDELRRLHGALPLAPGPHVLEAVRPGFASRTVQIEVGVGEPLRLELKLEPDERPAEQP